MNDTKNNILKIKVEGDDKGIPVESFLELLGQTISILKDLDANISESANGNLDWEIVAASLNSPLSLSVESRSDLGLNNGNEVIHAYLAGVNGLDKGEIELPQFFTIETLQKAKSLTSIFTQGITKVSFSTNDGETVTTTKSTFENATIVIKNNEELQGSDFLESEELSEVSFILPQTQRIKEKATLVGKLEVVSVHGRQPHFIIFDPLTKKKIDCYFDEQYFEEIQAMLSLEPYRVQVTGTAKYDRNGNPTSIRVEQFRKLRNQKDLPQFKDLSHINLTGDIDPTEYVRRLRDE